MVIFHLVIILVGRKACVELSKNLILSRIQQLSYGLLCCVLIYGYLLVDSKPCDYLCLLAPLVWRLFLQPIGAT
jgi:hypothetical protein